ncbi:MAG: glycoside hydrolase family 3 C-terminal domain-containing protein [Myxococcota bacterium]|nr:glycoside hydrolase family 3 C-terminal domain-containing protein [Myxococcota bacterium]
MTAFSSAVANVTAGGDPTKEAREILTQMSVEEKLWCLDGDTRFWPGTFDLGQGGYFEHPWPAAKIERLGIPGLNFADGPRGCVVGPCTAFPVTMARGATFNPDLERRIGEAIGKELRAQGANYTGAVCVNLLRHPAWGRAQETYGEDPHHVGELGAALTEGLQHHVMACMKHFAANSMENARFKVDVCADERALHEVYLPHFKRIHDAGVASVMSAYNALNGEWCGDSKTLLTTILRDEWGFEGFVITDFALGMRDPVQSVAAGCNIEMPFRQQRATTLSEAIESGALSIDAVDARVTETISTFLRFAHVYENASSPDVIACNEHRALAREAASASMVLLQNKNEILPLEVGSLRRVAVLGKLADVPNLGDGGSSNVLQPQVTTPLAGLRAALEGVEVVHSNSDATIAEGSDVILVVVGYTKEDEGEFVDPSGMTSLAHLFPPIDDPDAGFPNGEVPSAQAASPDDPQKMGLAPGGDRSSLRLRPEDEALIQAATVANTNVVVAVMAGSAVVMPWLEDVSAALMLWYPGMEGGHALADVLLGKVEPGGRLPFAIPHDESELVPFNRESTSETYGLLHGQWWLDHKGVRAHRPFGFGLGYTTFKVSNVSVTHDRVHATVQNTGERHGSTVVQIYGAVPDSVVERPVKRLVGFARVELARGDSAEVDITVDREALDIRRDGQWVREPLRVAYRIGFDANSAVSIE